MYHGIIYFAMPELWLRAACVCCRASDDELGYHGK